MNCLNIYLLFLVNKLDLFQINFLKDLSCINSLHETVGLSISFFCSSVSEWCVSVFLLCVIFCSLIFLSITDDKNGLKQMSENGKRFQWRITALRYINSPDNYLRGKNHTGKKDESCYFTWLRMVFVLTYCHMLNYIVIHFFMPPGNVFIRAEAGHFER